MSLSFGAWVWEFVDDRDLTGYARERAEEELVNDETLRALWKAQYAADDRQGNLRTFDGDEPAAVGHLAEARRACNEAIGVLAERVVRDTLDAEVHGHSVDLRQSTRLDCPGCGESDVEAYHLGHADGVAGWVCGHCGATVEQDPETGAVTGVAESQA
ncbi:eL43 family ribosomal protein [Halostella litorea]|uniref:hypothetical protein n=1 Tax=Halostella litorea TaxID=2528831 RepID=UPI00109324EA|nr:hypothetical protein [Halostella litorea]